MNEFFVKPAAGLSVREPHRGFRLMPAEGDHVPDNGYWRRRLAAGEVVPAEAPKPASDDAKRQDQPSDQNEA